MLRKFFLNKRLKGNETKCLRIRPRSLVRCRMDQPTGMLNR